MSSSSNARPTPLKVAWISYFPLEWLDNMPDEVKRLPRQHPATWQQALLTEMETFPGLKLHVVVVRSTFERDLRFERNGVTFHLLKTKPGWRAPTLFWTDTLRIRRVLREVEPDVVHAWGTENGAALVALRLGYPHLVSIQGLFDWFRQLIPLNRYEKLATQLERYSLKRARLISAESAATVARVESGFHRRGVLHIEHPPMRHFFRIHRSPSEACIKFLTVGTMGHRKGSDLYLRALDRLIDELNFRCVAIGRPNEAFLAPLRSVLSPKLWNRFEFKYSLTDQEMDVEYQSANLTVMPTRADTGPVAAKEAVVAGIPVVASHVGGVPEYVVPNRNGLICQPNDLQGLVENLRSACSHPRFSRGLVDDATLAEKRRHLDPRRAAELFVQAYRRAFAEQHRC